MADDPKTTLCLTDPREVLALLRAGDRLTRYGPTRWVLAQAGVEVADEAEGGEGLSVKEAAKRIGISKSALYEELRKVQEEGGADDLEESDGP